jgi:hypothetical protein
VVVCLCAGLALSGCGHPGQPTPSVSLATRYVGSPPPGYTPRDSPTPTVAPSSTPDPSDVAYQMDPANWTATPTNPELFDQALQVYLNWYADYIYYFNRGGIDQIPPDMAALMTGNFAGLIQVVLQHREQVTYDGTPQFTLEKQQPLTEDVPDGTVVALQVCEEQSGAASYDANGQQVATDGVYLTWARYYFKYDDQGQLVIFEYNGTGEASCPLT